ncbi:MAG: hypothetical protein JNM84_19885 [Planctomycetes bacterium]|nr:hypothetical protein [Planctomycetota bacterium]
MAKPRMTVEGSVREALARRPDSKTTAAPGLWKKVLLWGGGILAVLSLLFCIFVVNVFEGSAEGFTAYIPRDVHFFLLKKNVEDDLGEGYEPHFLPPLRDSQFWADFRATGDFERRVVESGLERFLDDVVAELEKAPIDLVFNLGGQEIAFAGRARESAAASSGEGAFDDLLAGAQFALHLRVRWKTKLAYRGVQWGFASSFAPGLSIEPVDDHFVLKGIYHGRDLLLWRFLDMVVVANDATYLAEIQKLTREAGSSRDSFRAGNLDYQMMERERASEDEDVSEAFFILRPRGVMAALGLVDPIPAPPEAPTSTLVGRFIGQIFSSELVDKVSGYLRASRDPLSLGTGYSGLRLRGQVQLKDVKDGEGTGIDSPSNIEKDREAFLKVKLDDSLSVPPVSQDDIEKSIATYAGILPDDVALFAYLAGDLSGLFHLVERSLAPSGKPGEDWDREEINRVFHAAITGDSNFGGYNRAVEALRSRRMNELPQEAARLARQYAESVGRASDAAFLEKRTELQQRALENQLPRPIVLDGEDGDLGLRKLLDRLAQLFAKDGDGRGMFVLRQNDYPDMRQQNASESSEQIPSFYRPQDAAPVWAFVFWIEERSPEEVRDTVATFLQQLRFSADPNDTARSLDVHVTSEVAGQHTLKEYWHPSIPGPGEIVTAVVPFYEEQQIEKRADEARTSRRSRGRKVRNDIHLFVLANHMMLAQDIAQAAILPARTRANRMARPRLDANPIFDTMLRRELDSERRSSLFAYWSGVELGEIAKQRLTSEAELELAIQAELDNPAEQRRLFQRACEELSLGHIYRDNLPLERLWKSVPPEKESALDQRIDQLRREAQRELVPRTKLILERRAGYARLVPHGMLSVLAVSRDPLKVDFQLFAGIDLRPAHD